MTALIENNNILTDDIPYFLDLELVVSSVAYQGNFSIPIGTTDKRVKTS